MHKKCPKCKNVKNLDEFHNSKKSKDGKQTYCIVCRRVICYDYVKKRLAIDEEFKNRLRKNGTNSRLRNKEKNREKNRIYHKKYQLENKEKLNENHKLWRDKNRESLRKYTREKMRERRKNPAYKILCNLRCRINNALAAKSVYSKTWKTKDLLGCEMEYFINYIGKQFKNGMTWENHGKIWHIDHIKPCSLFDLTQLEEQEKCFHYTNMQPLWATTKIAKEHGDLNSIGNINKYNHF